MKILLILSLILAFWCHQTHHQLFMLINTSPLSLASEEFIPVSEVPSHSEGISESQPHEEVAIGSQKEKSENAQPEPDKKLPKETHTVKESKEGIEETLVDNRIKQSEATSQHPQTASSSKCENDKLPGDNTIDEVSNGNDAVRRDPSESINIPPPPSVQKVGELENEQISESDESKSNDLSHHPDEAEEIANVNLSATPIPESSQTDEKLHTDGTGSLPSVNKTPSPPPVDTTTAAPAAEKEEEPIPSFMEWTQQKLHESNLAQGGTASGGHNGGQNGQKGPHSANSQQNKSTQPDIVATKSRKDKESTAKNFASPDCGAKVIQSNPESQNANGVLSSSHDEYMLNKCGVPIWFIIELCEPLKIEKVSVGNLELFSSSPKEVEIGISDRYPTRDWTKLGPFTLPDIRAIHSINFPRTNASTFGKFLKVNVLSHYGTEHFCPLSLVRVNGISEYEVLESENTHPGDDIEPSEKEESALYEEPVIHQQSTEGNVADKSVFGSAKDAVINIVKKAAQVLAKSDTSKDSSQPGSDSSVQSQCRSLLQCLPNYEAHLKEQVFKLLSCNFSNMLPFLIKKSPWCGWDYCHALFSRHSIGLPWQPEGFFASIFGGPSVLHALCNYHRPLTKESCDTLFLTNASTSSDDKMFDDKYINDSLKSAPVNIGSAPAETTEAKENPMEDDSKTQNDIKAVEPPEATGTMESLHKDKVPEVEPVQVPAESGHGGINGEPQQVQQPPPSTQIPPGNGDEQVIPTSQSGGGGSSNQQQASSGQQQQQKESVFVRLSNRIKTLERNQSLTASYLEELSRRFKKQNEENSHLNEGTKNFMNDSRNKFKILEDLYKFELRSLRRNTDEIRERLFNVQLQRSLLIVLCLLQFLGIVSVCVWVRKRFRQFESQIEVRGTPGSSSSPAVVPALSSGSLVSPRSSGSPQYNILGRKRVNSDVGPASALSSIDKSKKIRKKKKKLADLKPITSKSSPGPLSAPTEYQGRSSEREFKFDPQPVQSTSASDYNIPMTSSSHFKENVRPEPPSHLDLASCTRSSAPSSLPSSITPINPITSKIGCAGDLLSTRVDSPFAMMSSTSANCFVDSGVSTSSRFALLASPGPPLNAKSTVLKRSGSLTSLDSSSTSSYGAKSATQSGVMNGHGHDDCHSQTQSINGSGKKRKNKGLKALMPKIFDR